MTDPTPINGRVSQRDLYDAISRLDEKIDVHYRRLDDRLRAIELNYASQAGEDELLKEQREIRAEQGVGRRWLVGIAIGVIFSGIANVMSLAALVS